MKDTLTLYQDLREAYRESHQKWVSGENSKALEALQRADHISFLLQLALKRVAPNTIFDAKGK